MSAHKFRSYYNQTTKLVEVVDMETGKVIAIQASKKDLANIPVENLEEVLLPTGEKVLIERGQRTPELVQWVVFSQTLVDIMCQHLIEGKSIGQVHQMEGMPTRANLAYWKKQYPHIIQQLDDAKSERAEYYRDKALEEAMKAESSKDPINATNAKIDALKWAAGVDNGKYASKTKADVSVNMPVQIIVKTGIERGETNERAVTGRQSSEVGIIEALPDGAVGEEASASVDEGVSVSEGLCVSSTGDQPSTHLAE